MPLDTAPRMLSPIVLDRWQSPARKFNARELSKVQLIIFNCQLQRFTQGLMFTYSTGTALELAVRLPCVVHGQGGTTFGNEMLSHLFCCPWPFDGPISPNRFWQLSSVLSIAAIAGWQGPGIIRLSNCNSPSARKRRWRMVAQV